ncbi:MAG: histidine kinase N-terminal 7TM domain-containing protein, partial [Candidatus Methylumidiphilus sp.]
MAEIIYSLTLYGCALGMAGLGEFVWRRYAQDPVARRFVVFCLIVGLWMFFCALDVLTRDLAIRTLLLQVRSAVIFFASASALSLVLAFTGHSAWLRPGRFYPLLAIPTAAALLVLTSSLQPWFVTDFRLVEAGIRARMVFTPQIGFKLYLLYTYGCFMACCAALAWAMRGKPPLYRRQASLLLLGLLIPTLTDILFTYEERVWVWFRGAYLTPFSMLAFVLLSAWALFRYRLFELAPVARNQVIESMADAVLVFDVHGRLADCNPAAWRLLGLANGAIGRPAQDVFACCPELAAGVGAPGERLLSLEACADPAQTLTGRLSPLFDRQGDFCGQVLLLHDISALQQAQRQLADTTALLEAAFAQTPIPMLLADMPSGRLRIVNPASRRHLGMDAEADPVGMRYAELAQNWPMLDAGGAVLAPEDLPLARAMRGETVRGQELGLRRADGS